MPTSETPGPSAADQTSTWPATAEQPSNWSLILRMIGLSWRYRASCAYVVLLHLLVVALSLSALGFTGVGIAVIGHHLHPEIDHNGLPAFLRFASD